MVSDELRQPASTLFLYVPSFMFFLVARHSLVRYMLCALSEMPRVLVWRDDWKEPTMLVLSRQRDESIVIGDNVVITIVDIRGDKVRLGIEAPGEIPVHRQEVYEAIQRENRKAGPPQSGAEASKAAGGDSAR